MTKTPQIPAIPGMTPMGWREAAATKAIKARHDRGAALLIAAAPALLELLKRIAASDEPNGADVDVAEIRAAIALATGEK